jgi:mannose-6-phosphate isomerase class I
LVPHANVEAVYCSVIKLSTGDEAKIGALTNEMVKGVVYEVENANMVEDEYTPNSVAGNSDYAAFCGFRECEGLH